MLPLTATKDHSPRSGDRPSARPDHLWAWVLGILGAVIAAYPLMSGAAEQITYRLVGLAAVIGIVAGIRRHRLERPLPWLLFAAGQLLFVLGDGVWAYYEAIAHEPPSPSLADVLYLAGYPMLAAGLGVLARRRAPARDSAGLIDAAIITIGAGVVAWVFLLLPYVSDATMAVPERLVAAAYPLGDLLLLALAVRMFLAPGSRTRAHWLLGLSLSTTLVTDVAYASQALQDGGVLSQTAQDVGWLIGYALLATALLDPTIRTVDRAGAPPAVTLTRRRLALLASASLLSPLTLAIDTLSGARPAALVIAGGSAAVFLLVVLRMSGLIRQVQEQAAQLAKTARTDALTGAHNRRAWDERLQEELARAARDDAPVTIALLDLDHFKQFNDVHGHVAGDELLRDAARGWRTQLRSCDVLARYGGEEFGVILPGCVAGEAEAIVERMRQEVPQGQTCSAGIASWDGRESGFDLVRRADDALYDAKDAGRDRTHVAPPAGARV